MNRSEAVERGVYILKLFIFVVFIFTAVVMYKLGNWIVGNFIVITIGMFMLYNKIDNLERNIRLV